METIRSRPKAIAILLYTTKVLVVEGGGRRGRWEVGGGGGLAEVTLYCL